MNAFVFLSALRARFGLFVAVLAATVLTSVVVSLLMPKSYRATASLVVDTGDAQTLSSPLNVVLGPQESMAYIQTQLDIITSPRVARKVVDETKLADDPKMRASFQKDEGGAGSIEAWLTANLLHDLEVQTSQSNVIDVNFTADDPAYAARIANAFAKSYVDTMLELRVEPTRNAATWFDEQLQTLRSDLEKAQAELTAFQRRHGIVSTDERLDVEHTRLAELTQQLVHAQDEEAELRSRAQQASDVLAAGGSLYALPEIQADTHIQKLRSELLDGEAELRKLATQYGDRHPTYLRQLAENRTRKQELEAELRDFVRGTANRTQQSQQRASELETALATQRTRLLEGKQSRDELAVLTRNVATAQQVYDTVMQRFVVSQVESRASRTNVAMLNSAVPPRLPYRPKLGLNVVLAIVIGGLLGIGLVALNEMSDRRVRSALDLDALLDMQGTNVPLLGALGPWTPSDHRLLPGRSRNERALPAPN